MKAENKSPGMKKDAGALTAPGKDKITQKAAPEPSTAPAPPYSLTARYIDSRLKQFCLR